MCRQYNSKNKHLHLLSLYSVIYLTNSSCVFLRILETRKIMRVANTTFCHFVFDCVEVLELFSLLDCLKSLSINSLLNITF